MYTVQIVEKILRQHREALAKMRMYELYLTESEEGIFQRPMLDGDGGEDETEIPCEAAISNAGIPPQSRSRVEAELERLRAQEQLVKSWLILLTPEERFILEVHTIGGLTWSKTLTAHEKWWGHEEGRSERTLKRIQQKAILRISKLMCQWLPDPG